MTKLWTRASVYDENTCLLWHGEAFAGEQGNCQIAHGYSGGVPAGVALYGVRANCLVRETDIREITMPGFRGKCMKQNCPMLKD